MKNKEIEELLNFLKEPLTKEKTHKAIDKKDTKLLLSYIEQLEKENQQLKKQKDDVIEYIKNYIELEDAPINERIKIEFKELLRMLGEIE